MRGAYPSWEGIRRGLIPEETMGFALYSKRKWIGLLGSATLYCMAVDAVKKYDRSRRGLGKITNLASFVEEGQTANPKAVVKDISFLLSEKACRNKHAVAELRNLMALLKKAKDSAFVSDA
jgi:hypothetical protein